METWLLERTLELAAEIQQIPAPTFAEAERAAFVKARLEAEGLTQVSHDEAGNIYACLPGAAAAKPLVVSAHLDTVFPAGTDLSLKRAGERIAGAGIGDNSLGVAGLFSLLWALREGTGHPHRTSLSGDVWLVANVCEEGLGDLRGMRAVVERFGESPRAYLILEGMALGQVYHRGLGVQRYRISAFTAGGHSWVDYGRPSAIHVLSALVCQLGGLVLPTQPRTSLNVGVINGGTSVNTIAAQAGLELDLRSESVETLAWLVGQVEGLVRSANRLGVRVEHELIGSRPAGEIPAAHPLVLAVQRSLEAQGVRPCLNIGSTDANVPLSMGLPAVCLGLTQGGGAHTVGEYITTAPLRQGLGQLIDLVNRLFA